MQTLNCKGDLIDLSIPRIMGIINCTPDSFYDGGKTTAINEIVAQAEVMLDEGATFLDVGGYSSRPGALEVSEEEELHRVIPAIQAILKAFPKTKISIDTFRSTIAKQAIEVGACMVNDISGGIADANMMAIVAKLQVPYILMHMKGTPQDMVSRAAYTNVTKEVLRFFSERIFEARKAGINDIIVDPGFGFAKTRNQSFELLSHLELFQALALPCLVGVSRKSMIYKSLNTTAEKALNGSTVLHSVALLKGASILRVHDVAEAVECVQLIEKLKSPYS